MLTRDQRALPMRCGDSAPASGGRAALAPCDDSLQERCGARALTRRTFASLAGVAVGSVLLGILPGCAGSGAESGAGQADRTAEAGKGSNSGEGGKSETPPISEGASDELSTAALAPGSLCVAEYANNTLAVIDPSTGEILQRIAAGQNPATALAVDGWVYVGSSGGGEVIALCVADPSQVAAIPVGRQPLGLCYDEARGVLYVADYFTSSIYQVDTALKSLVGTVKLDVCGYHKRTDPPDCCRIGPGEGRRTVALALAPEGDVLYCANYGTFDVARVDLAGAAEIEAFDGVVGPRQILVSTDGTQLILAGVGGEGEQQVSDLYVLDRATGKRVLEVPVGQSVAGVAQAADGSAAWAIARDDGELVVFDANWAETGRLPLGEGIDTLALAPDGKTLLVANSATGQVHVVDAATFAVLNTIEGLAAPKGIAVIP